MVHIPPPTWNVDYKGAIQVEAAQYGYVANNNPKAWCLHTPEEPADDTPSTPYYFHNTANQASTHYYVSFTGFVYQQVPENEGAYANVREMGERFSWEDATNLNLQTLNIEIEGFAHNIHLTMVRGGPQWRALVMLLADRCQAHGFPIERMFGHKVVSPSRRDPGALRLDWLVHDVNKLLEESEEGDDDMAQILVKPEGRNEVYILVDGCRLQHTWGSSVTAPGSTVKVYPVDHWVWKLPTSYYEVPQSLLE